MCAYTTKILFTFFIDIETHEENIHEILEDETDGEDIHEISEDETNEKDIHEISEDETNEENIHEISEDETIEEDIHEISENETDEEDIHEISENETNEEQVEEITEDVIYDEDIYLIPEDDYSYLDDTPETENLPFHPVDWNATNIQSKSNNSSDTCTVCLTDERTHAFVPCGHLACCLSCIESLKDNRCPICNVSYETYTRIRRP
ncbi:hypothetical protein PUN28_010427 [Cardiocondyla obscurior]|uniref:RING-type domain-containing protein n=1 Tax=Cardiocondyla obscurior TaxID=286306 RepID=A0AAW2FHH2_9HYME